MLLSMDEFRAFEPKKTTYALFGWPLGHTMSPELHAQLFEAAGQDADYIGVAVPPEDLLEAFELAKRKLGGINCTIPHKKAVIPLLDEIDTAARDLHSVNTVRFADGKATGFNTDILGFAESLNRDGVSLQGKKVLLLGYGGAASVMAYHCVTQGAYLTITGRNLEKAETLQKQLTDAVPGARISVFSRRHIPRDIHVVLNSTPVGMYPNVGVSALDITSMPGLEAVIDVIYNPDKTELILRAEELGVPVAVGGLEMLVAQAVYAAEFFLDRKFEDAGAEIARVTSELRREQLNIALIGMPSSGKSTLGRTLAERLGKRFVDLDEEIVKADGRSIPDIFAAEGEAGFRKLEAAQTARFARENRQVISCGGGVVKDPANLRALHANGIVLFIDRPLEDLLVGGGRPLSTSPEALKTMEAQRRPLYLAAADAVIPNKTTPADAVTAAMEALDEIFSH